MPCLKQHYAPVQSREVTIKVTGNGIKRVLTDKFTPRNEPTAVTAYLACIILQHEVEQCLIAVVHAIIERQIFPLRYRPYGFVVPVSRLSLLRHKRKKAHPHYGRQALPLFLFLGKFWKLTWA